LTSSCIIAITAPEAKEKGNVAVRVVDLDGARATLKEAKMAFSEEEALNIELDNRPGAFGELMQKLAQANINIRFAYATTSAFARARVIVAVPDVNYALAVLVEQVWAGLESSGNSENLANLGEQRPF
jgi:hypothetical protein